MLRDDEEMAGVLARREKEKIRKQREPVYALLAEVKLSEYGKQLFDMGYSEIQDLKHAQDDDLLAIFKKKPWVTRLRLAIEQLEQQTVTEVQIQDNDEKTSPRAASGDNISPTISAGGHVKVRGMTIAKEVHNTTHQHNVQNTTVIHSPDRANQR